MGSRNRSLWRIWLVVTVYSGWFIGGVQALDRRDPIHEPVTLILIVLGLLSLRVLIRKRCEEQESSLVFRAREAVFSGGGRLKACPERSNILSLPKGRRGDLHLVQNSLTKYLQVQKI